MSIWTWESQEWSPTDFSDNEVTHHFTCKCLLRITDLWTLCFHSNSMCAWRMSNNINTTTAGIDLSVRELTMWIDGKLILWVGLAIADKVQEPLITRLTEVDFGDFSRWSMLGGAFSRSWFPLLNTSSSMLCQSRWQEQLEVMSCLCLILSE